MDVLLDNTLFILMEKLYVNILTSPFILLMFGGFKNQEGENVHR